MSAAVWRARFCSPPPPGSYSYCTCSRMALPGREKGPPLLCRPAPAHRALPSPTTAGSIPLTDRPPLERFLERFLDFGISPRLPRYAGDKSPWCCPPPLLTVGRILVAALVGAPPVPDIHPVCRPSCAPSRTLPSLTDNGCLVCSRRGSTSCQRRPPSQLPCAESRTLPFRCLPFRMTGNCCGRRGMLLTALDIHHVVVLVLRTTAVFLCSWQLRSPLSPIDD